MQISFRNQDRSNGQSGSHIPGITISAPNHTACITLEELQDMARPKEADSLFRSDWQELPRNVTALGALRRAMQHFAINLIVIFAIALAGFAAMSAASAAFAQGTNAETVGDNLQLAAASYVRPV